MTLSLDSNVIIELMQQRLPHYRSRLREASDAGDQVVVSTIVAQELMLGAHLSSRPANQLELLGETLLGMEVEPWTWDDAVVTGRLRAERERMGRRLGAFDSLIAGQALARGWIVVTADVRGFWDVNGLSIIDWSDPAGPIDVTGGAARFRPPSKD